MRLSHHVPVLLTVLFFLLFVPFLPSAAAGSDELRVEGIAYDSKDPRASIAVINGVTLQSGDMYQGVKIISVDPDSVKIFDSAKQSERVLHLVGGTPAKVQEQPVVANPEAAAQPEQPKQGQGASPVKPAGGFSWNPLEMLNMVKGVQVLNNLRQLYTGASVYYSQEGGVGETITLKALAERRLIPADMATGEVGGYRYAVRDTGNGVEATADPVIDGPNSLHYLIDEFGNMRQEVGRPATAGSQRSGGKMTDEMQSKMKAMSGETGAMPPSGQS